MLLTFHRWVWCQLWVLVEIFYQVILHHPWKPTIITGNEWYVVFSSLLDLFPDILFGSFIKFIIFFFPNHFSSLLVWFPLFEILIIWNILVSGSCGLPCLFFQGGPSLHAFHAESVFCFHWLPFIKQLLNASRVGWGKAESLDSRNLSHDSCSLFANPLPSRDPRAQDLESHESGLKFWLHQVLTVYY